MLQLTKTKLRIYIGLVVTVLILVILRVLGFTDLHFFVYTEQVRIDATKLNFSITDIGYTKMNILQKIPKYMEITSLGDLHTTANAENSYVEIVNNKSQYDIGDTIEIYIKLRDSHKRNINKGGDIVRIWMTEERLNASAGGHVIDFNDGSFLGIVKLLWVGSPKITIAIGCTKEHIGVYLNFIEKHGTFFYVIGRFEKKNQTGKAETQCVSVPKSPLMNGQICNFTADNFNMPFYCEKPAEYECKDWTIFRDHSERPPLDGKSSDSFFRTSVYAQIKKITVSVGVDSFRRRQVLSPVKSCSDFQAAQTWNRTLPVGYMYRNNWISLKCSIDFPRTVQSYTKCLTKRPLILVGDSTTRIFFRLMMDFLSLELDTAEVKYMKDKSWQRPVRASSQDGQVIMEWMPHEHPFASAGFRKNLRSVSARLSEIGSNSNAIILIHWFLHPARFLSPYLYRHHVKNAVDAIKSLLKRSPKAKILIKGPHSQTYPHYFIPYDFVARYMEQILYEEFKDIRNSVYYVDYWDLTLGTENVMPHPPDYVNSIMIHNFLAFVCHK